MGNSAQLKEVRPDVRKKPQERRVSAGVGEAGVSPSLGTVGPLSSQGRGCLGAEGDSR